MEVIFNVRNTYLRKYLEYIFEQKDDKLLVSRSSDLGRLCIARLSRSSSPVKIEKCENSVTFILPKSINIQQVSERYWLYYDKFDTHRLNDALAAESNIDFKMYFLSGIENGFMKKDIINSYIESRRLFIDSFDCLKKRAYRSSEKSLEKTQKYLLNKISFINKKITNGLVIDINRYISES